MENKNKKLPLCGGSKYDGASIEAVAIITLHFARPAQIEIMQNNVIMLSTSLGKFYLLRLQRSCYLLVHTSCQMVSRLLIPAVLASCNSPGSSSTKRDIILNTGKRAPQESLTQFHRRKSQKHLNLLLLYVTILTRYSELVGSYSFAVRACAVAYGGIL